MAINNLNFGKFFCSKKKKKVIFTLFFLPIAVMVPATPSTGQDNSTNSSVLLNLLMRGEDRSFGYRVNNGLNGPKKAYHHQVSKYVIFHE